MNNLIIRFKYINKNSISNLFFMFKVSIFEIIFNFSKLFLVIVFF